MTTYEQDAQRHSSQETNSRSDEMKLGRDSLDYLREYAHQRPEMVALCSFALGFVLGWKLKLW